MASSSNATSASNDDAAKCPVDHKNIDWKTISPDHPFYAHAQKMLAREEGAAPAPAAPAAPAPAAKPVEGEKINPLNMMPELSQDPHPTQQAALPTERSFSTIPKSSSTDMDEEKYGGKEDKVWVYPSPQQFYNALKRKGWETPEEHVPVMVDIHNFLNEACWQEILKWEKLHECECANPLLLKFQGRPSELSPRARMMTTFFGSPKPFDRHDWYVDRCGKTVRYVIDYYSGTEEVPGQPVFNVDVRPAVDSFTAVSDRFKVAFGGLYDQFRAKWSGEGAK